MLHERRLLMASLLTAANLLWITEGCTRKEDQVQAMRQKAEEADKLDRQLQQAGSEQAKMLGQAGLPEGTVALNEEQKKALEDRVRAEKGVSTQALLQEILDKDKVIKELNDKIATLRAGLPKPMIAQEGNHHLDLALQFLRSKGVSENEARKLAGRVSLYEQLEPGNQVYHFFVNGQYGTWVTQGKAKVPPMEVARRATEQLTDERDAAVGKAGQLETHIAELMQEKQGIETEIADLQSEKRELQLQMEKLATRTARQEAKLNSLHYHVGELGQLKKDGLIIVPLIGKDRLGPMATDSSFDRDFPLKADAPPDGIVIRASEVGVKQIRNVHVVPSSLLKDQHYALTVSEDQSTATIRILSPERFRNDKVVFAVSG